MSHQRDRELVRSVLQLTDPPGSRAMPYTDEELDNILREVNPPQETIDPEELVLVQADLAQVGGLLKQAIALRDTGKLYEDGLRGTPGSGIGIYYYMVRVIRILRGERDRLIMRFMVKDHEMVRLSGEVTCEICGDRYGLHVRADKSSTPTDPTLVRLCDGRLGKT